MSDCLLCAKCCEQTGMLLAKEDIRRIEQQTNYRKQDFSIVKNGYYYLKNKGKYCFFLNPRLQCVIYEFRPQGCQFYPIIYDPLLKKCVVDQECTNRGNINQTVVLKLCPEIRDFIYLLEKERNERVR